VLKLLLSAIDIIILTFFSGLLYLHQLSLLSWL